MAVTYNGLPGTANNFTMYWTAMDPSLTTANQILSATMNLSLPTGTVDFCIGNQGRTTPNNNFIGLIDEVRVSSIARGAGAMMFVPEGIVINTQPRSQIAQAGDNVILTTVASGEGTLHYQWQFYATNLPSATDSMLVISNLSPAQVGPYRVVIDNGITSQPSQAAVVSLGVSFTDLYSTGLKADRSPLLGSLLDPHYTLVQSDDPLYPGPDVYVESALPAAWRANSETSQWVAPADGANLAAGNYTYRTTFVLNSGDPGRAELNANVIGDNFVFDILLNGNSTGLTNSGSLSGFTSFIITNGFVPGLNTIDLVISNTISTGVNRTGLRAELRGAAIPLEAVAPQVVAPAADVSTQTQQTATFAPVITGSPTLVYQWYQGATALPGKTDRTLVLPNLTPGQGGTYTVYVTNSFGWTSASAALIVTAPPALAWTGAAGTMDWDTLSVNWLNLGTSAGAVFAQNNDVLFDARGSSQPTVNLVEAITPNSLTVDAANDYTLTSFFANGWLKGSFPLVKKGGGKLILSVTNLATGPVVIQGGSLQVGNSDTIAGLGAGPVSISNNAALLLARADRWNVPNEISGAGALTTVSGTAVLIASNTFTGPTVVQMLSTLVLRHGSALGSPAAGTTVEPFAQLFIDTAIDLPAEPITLSGAGLAGDGALRKGGSGVSVLGGPITLADDAAIKVDGGSTLRLTNAAGLNLGGKVLSLLADSGGNGVVDTAVKLGGGLLVKDGAGTWQLLSTANTGPGSFLVNAGTLQLGNGLVNGSLVPGIITNNGTLAFFGATDQIIGGEITGAGGLAQNGSNTTTLVGANTYDGVTAVNNGTLLVAHNSALGNPDTNTTISGNFGAVSRVAFSNNVTVPEAFTLAGRQPADISEISAHLINLSGTNTLAGPINLTSGGNQYNLESANGLLVVAGIFTPTLTGRFLNLQGAAQGLWAGAIEGANTLTKRGSGMWTLAGANTYSGPTVITEGTLAVEGSLATNTVTVQGGSLSGTGVINGAVTVQSSGTLAPGNQGIGLLAISNRLVLAVGSTNAADINGSSAACDQVVGLTSITYGGTLAINNLGGTVANGASFKLFDAVDYAGAFAAIQPSTPGGGLAWDASSLGVDGTLRVIGGLAQTPTNITFSVSDGALNLSWPATHKGWFVQSNSVSISAGNEWFDVSGSDAGTELSIPINPATHEVYYRLSKP